MDRRTARTSGSTGGPTNTPSHPASSAVTATSTTASGSASSSDSDSDRPHRTHGTVATGAGIVVGRMERFGLVGLPNAGKSSLYNALTGGGALAAPYAFATKDPNIGVAKVPDERLDRLAEMSSSRNVVHAAVQVVDIGGLVEGASKGEGLGNKFLANIREVDAIVLVLRAFEDDDVTGPSDPLEHLRVVEIELALADLETVEKRLHQAQRQAKLDRSLGDEIAALQVAYDALSGGPSALPRRAECGPADNAGPTLPADQPPRPRRRQRRGGRARRHPRGGGARRRRAQDDAGENVEIIGMCVQLEAEAAAIEDPVDRAEMLEGFGLGEGALFRMVRSAYHLLGLRTFLTTGDKGRGRGRSTRAPPRRNAPGASTPTSSAASSAPRSSSGTNC